MTRNSARNGERKHEIENGEWTRKKEKETEKKKETEKEMEKENDYGHRKEHGK